MPNLNTAAISRLGADLTGFLEVVFRGRIDKVSLDLGRSSTTDVRSQPDLSTHGREITVACH
jgi:hypothetical protein